MLSYVQLLLIIHSTWEDSILSTAADSNYPPLSLYISLASVFLLLITITALITFFMVMIHHKKCMPDKTNYWDS